MRLRRSNCPLLSVIVDDVVFAEEVGNGDSKEYTVGDTEGISSCFPSGVKVNSHFKENHSHPEGCQCILGCAIACEDGNLYDQRS